jgi:hypothetical protein
MTWNFEDLVKGQVTQAILHTVLERVGYRVCRSGIEELLPELRGPSLKIDLPERLRFIPDFLVIDPDTGAVFLTEVKFRARLTSASIRSLCSEILARRQFWPETITVVMLGEPERSRGYHQDHIRVITASMGQGALLAEGSLLTWWENLPPLQEVFKRIFGSFDNQQIVDSITSPLRILSRLPRPRSLSDVEQSPPEL